MQRRSSTVWCVLPCVILVAWLAVAGCEREESQPVIVPPPTAPTTVPAGGEQDAGEQDAGEQAGAEGATVDEATRVKFNTLVEQVTLHIRNREFEAAETGLAQLEQMRGTITDAMKQQIDTTRAALTAARAAPAAPPAK